MALQGHSVSVNMPRIPWKVCPELTRIIGVVEAAVVRAKAARRYPARWRNMPCAQGVRPGRATGRVFAAMIHPSLLAAGHCACLMMRGACCVVLSFRDIRPYCDHGLARDARSPRLPWRLSDANRRVSWSERWHIFCTGRAHVLCIRGVCACRRPWLSLTLATCGAAGTYAGPFSSVVLHAA